MPADLRIIRSVAGALPGVEERRCHGTPAFYVGRKLLARLQDDPEMLSIACSRDVREELIEKVPDVFSVTEHFRNYDYVLVSLVAVNRRLLEETFESAWRLKATRKDREKFAAEKKPGNQPERDVQS